MFTVDENRSGFNFDGILAQSRATVVAGHLLKLHVTGEFDFLFDGDLGLGDLGLHPGKVHHDTRGDKQDNASDKSGGKTLIADDENKSKKTQGGGDEIRDGFHRNSFKQVC
jgi:hypothetical protein